MRKIALLILLALVLEVNAKASEVISNIRIKDTVDIPHAATNRFEIPITIDSYIESKYKIERGFVCNSSQDIKCIQGLCGDSDYYWAISLNGDTQNTSINSTLSPGDVLELVYKKKIRADHRRLQDWLLSSSIGR